MSQAGVNTLPGSALLTHRRNLHRRFSMSLHRGFTLSLKLFVVMLLVLTITSMALAAKSAPANSIFVHNQETLGGVATIDQVTAARDGWVVVYKRADLAPDMIVGYAPVRAGDNDGVRVTLENARLKDINTLWIRLHVDEGAKGVFEWGRGKPLADYPVSENGQPVLTTFGTRGFGADLPVAPAINIRSQSLGANSIIVDSVSTPVDGWLVVYKDPPPFHSDDIVGFVPVYHGLNRNLKMAIQGWRAEKSPTLWATLYEDKATQKLMEVGYKGLTYGDPQLLYKGQPVIVTFGSRSP